MIYNVYFDVFAVVISFFSIILAFTKKDFWKRQNFILFVLLVATFFASVFDILSSVGNSYIVVWSYGLRDVLNYGYLTVQNSMSYLFCLYIVFLTEADIKKEKRKRKWFHMGLALPYTMDVVLLALNPFLREVFFYDANRVYNHDWGMIVLYVNALIYLGLSYYLIFRHGKEVKLVKKATVYVFLTSSLLAVVFQIIFPTILLQLCVEALCLSGILFTVENENNILHSILLYFFLLLLSFFAEVEIIPNAFPWRMISSLYFLMLGVLLVVYFAERIADRGKLKKWLLVCAWLIVIFMIFRTIRYEAFGRATIGARYIWYLYYLPMLFIPLCTFYATLHIDGESRMQLWMLRKVFGAITTILFLLVITNDLHGTVFRFPAGISNWVTNYTYGCCFYLILSWIYFLYLLAIMLMFKRCQLPNVKRLWWVTIIPFVMGISLQLLIVTGKMPTINGLMIVEFPEVVCFMIALFWECCIRIGLIPTNKGYGELMQVCSLDLQITDEEGKPIYKSPDAAKLSSEYHKIKEPTKLDEDTVLYCEQIPGGQVYWQNDISALNETNRKLEEVHGMLEEESELIRLENELKEKQVAIEQRTALYDLINTKTAKQARRIAQLAEEALQTQEPETRNHNAEVICFLGAYIKRYANLTLLAQNDKWMDVAELGMAASESLRYLTNTGIPGTYAGEAKGKIHTKAIILLYEILQKLIEESLPMLNGIYVKLEESDGMILKMALEGVEATLSEDIMDRLFLEGIPVTVKHEDHISYIRFRLTKEV